MICFLVSARCVICFTIFGMTCSILWLRPPAAFWQPTPRLFLCKSIFLESSGAILGIGQKWSKPIIQSLYIIIPYFAADEHPAVPVSDVDVTATGCQ